MWILETPHLKLGDLSQRIYELRKVPCESSPALAGKELTAPVLSCGSPLALRKKRQRSLSLTPSPSATLSVFSSDRLWLSGKKGNGLKSCGSHMGLSTICFANRDKSPSEAGWSAVGALRLFEGRIGTHCRCIVPAFDIMIMRPVQNEK